MRRSRPDSSAIQEQPIGRAEAWTCRRSCDGLKLMPKREVLEDQVPVPAADLPTARTILRRHAPSREWLSARSTCRIRFRRASARKYSTSNRGPRIPLVRYGSAMAHRVREFAVDSRRPPQRVRRGHLVYQGLDDRAAAKPQGYLDQLRTTISRTRRLDPGSLTEPPTASNR